MKKTPVKREKVGRPSKYDPVSTPDTIRALARKGHTVDEMAKVIGVNRDTIFEWQNKYPDFSDALKEGKAVADSNVEAALYKRAVGYEYEEIKTVNDGERVEKTTKQVAPDVTAQIFWLKNRLPREWRDKTSTELTGKDGGPVELTTLSDERLAALLLKGKAA